VIALTTISTTLTAAVKQELIGETKFIRAFCNFYLVNIYGNIPLVTTTDYGKNAVLGQSPPEAVYAQIVADLKVAQGLLGAGYLDFNGNMTTERVRPNSAAAAALLARVYLYEGAYDSAEQQANTVINNPTYKLYQGSLGLDSVFLTTSQEAIWQLELPGTDFGNTMDGYIFTYILVAGSPSNYAAYTLSDSLIESFEANDLRRANWVDSVIVGTTTYYIPYKYQAGQTGQAPVEYPTILRLAEQYLIRAEARARRGNLGGAIADLDTVRSRAGLPFTQASSQGDLLTAILHERRVELFTEYGHRWLDLKRTGLVNQVMDNYSTTKGGTWTATDSLYPIPYNDLLSDPNLKQNSGYQ
jgi:hypothetical protein